MSKVTVIVGAQWGDEGKGKWVDTLAETPDIIARYQGGNNAGHTIYVDGKKVVLHLLPSGIFKKNKICALGCGVVINPVEMMKEIETTKDQITVTGDNLFVSAKAHVTTPWHLHLDAHQESTAKIPIGTTKRGIGPTYSDKTSRKGLRIGQYVDDSLRKSWIDGMLESNPEFKTHYEKTAAEWKVFEDNASNLLPFVCDAELEIRKAIKAGKEVLLEGAQGTLLDIDHGTYPFVTSSSTAAGGCCSGVGISPRTITDIYGIAKAYVTRVGEGPFPTELFDDTGKELAKLGNEFGATTGRPRRCGWLDIVALKYACDLNGFTGLIINKMDILETFKEIKLAVAYKHPKLGTITDMPWDSRVLDDCEPVYETMAGWNSPIPKQGKISDLPEAAQKYLGAIEKLTGVKVTMVGTGPGPDDTLFV